MVFMQPQRLVVPLFQRPYVWNLDDQWEPLWNDVVRVAERLRSRPQDRHYPHFLGAVVLQQVQRPTGLMQERTIIDGQQRLTTLQLLLDALHAELLSVNVIPPAMRIEPLVANAEPFRARPEDRFKVWPTNRDRGAFNAVMGAEPPVNHDGVGYRGERLVEAHRFFSAQARQWLALDGANDIPVRAAVIETVVRELLQMVVIDLAADENAQEIFETLNARGAPLTAADLIKNFVFQRLLESGADVENAYQTNWKEFETGFWETEVSVGRVRYPRSSIFLNHLLIARTGQEVVAREVFSRFKSYADFDAAHGTNERISMTELVKQVHNAAGVYRQFIVAASTQTGPVDRLALFGYRTGVLESEVIKPLVLYLLDPEEPSLPDAQLTKALNAVESWMVRRMLVRATTKNYNQVVSELIAQLRKSGRDTAGDATEKFLAGQTSGSRYWPDDNEVLTELRGLLAYRRLRRGRLRMVLEAIEDHERGWRDSRAGLGGERVARGKYTIEHVMPRRWSAHWPPPDSPGGETDRDQLVHTIGNLTLLTGKLNSKVSNGPWLGQDSKRAGLVEHDVLILNRKLLEKAGESWTDELIRARTDELAQRILDIWRVPEGHSSSFAHEKVRAPRRKVGLADLIGAGLLAPGMSLFPRRKKHADKVATLLADGQLEINGVVFPKPSPAASAVTGTATNGWWFFLVDQAARRSLRDVWRDYMNSLPTDVEDEEADEEGDEDDASEDNA